MTINTANLQLLLLLIQHLLNAFLPLFFFTTQPDYGILVFVFKVSVYLHIICMNNLSSNPFPCSY